MTVPALLSVADVAAAVGLSEYTIRAKVRAGDIPACKLAGRIRIRPDDLAAWVDAGRVRPAAAPPRVATPAPRPRAPRPVGTAREAIRASRRQAA